jgi:hypothetical protein
MSDAKRNVMDKTPWLPEKDRGASPTSTDMMGSMADGMGMTREKTLQPSMPPKGEKAPGAT